jgi:type IV secretion system protein VirB5
MLMLNKIPMFVRNCRMLCVLLTVSIAAAPAARAQWAVVDAPAIAQLIQEVQTLQQQLATARATLQSSQQALQAITGERGMQGLLSGTTRNYLPANWGQVMSAAQGQRVAGYAGLSAAVQQAIAVNAVLPPSRVATLSPAAQQQILASRQWTAVQQAVTQEALANSSARFAALQGLIAAISSAKDQKAILDLQARIGAELGMLQNEQSKLLVLFQATQAQEAVLRQQAQERAIAENGQFATRFQPVP